MLEQNQSQNQKQTTRLKIADLQKALLNLGAEPEDIYTQKKLNHSELYKGRKSRLKKGQTVADREDFFQFFHGLLWDLWKAEGRWIKAKTGEVIIPYKITRCLRDYIYIQEMWCKIRENRPEYKDLI
jgi:hypothetical protein